MSIIAATALVVAMSLHTEGDVSREAAVPPRPSPQEGQVLRATPGMVAASIVNNKASDIEGLSLEDAVRQPSRILEKLVSALIIVQ